MKDRHDKGTDAKRRKLNDDGRKSTGPANKSKSDFKSNKGKVDQFGGKKKGPRDSQHDDSKNKLKKKKPKPKKGKKKGNRNKNK